MFDERLNAIADSSKEDLAPVFEAIDRTAQINTERVLAAFREGAALPSAVRRIGVSEARIYGEDEKGTESEKKAPKESAAPQRSPLPKAKATPQGRAPQGRPANRTKGKPSAWPSAGKKNLLVFS